MVCGEKGSTRELARKLGIDVPQTRAERRRQEREGVTLRQLADSKSLPLTLLRELGWHDTDYNGRPAIAIPYRDNGGCLLRDQIRLCLDE